MNYRMPPVELEEAQRYVTHRLRTANGDPDVFDPKALDQLLSAANGRLRKIDDLCDHALYVAFIAQAKPVDPDHVKTVLADRP